MSSVSRELRYLATLQLYALIDETVKWFCILLDNLDSITRAWKLLAKFQFDLAMCHRQQYYK